MFVDNDASRGLLQSIGFREVGTYHRHAKLDGVWRDVVIVEKFLAPIPQLRSVESTKLATVPVRGGVLEGLGAADAVARAKAFDDARALVESGEPDTELLEASVKAFVLGKPRAPQARAHFGGFVRSYVAKSEEAAAEVSTCLFHALGRLSVALDREAFYDAAFVIKQTLGPKGTTFRERAAFHLPVVMEWLRLTIDLPPDPRSRISPANLTTLLLSLATTMSASEEQRREILALLPTAMQRHRISPPSSMCPPPMPTAPPLPLADTAARARKPKAARAAKALKKAKGAPKE